VNRVVLFNRRDWGSIRRAVQELRAGPFDFAVDFQGLIKSALLATFARPERIYGFAHGETRETPASWCYSSSASTTSAHIVDKNLELAALAGGRSPQPSFSIPQGAPDGDLPAGPFVLANPLAGWGSKQWPLEYYAELAALLKIPLVLNGAPSTQSVLREVKGAQVHISGLAGLIDATRRAAAVVGVDSGPLHLAAALNKPGIAIYGPTDPARNGPYGGSIEVIRASGAVTSYKRDAGISESMRSVRPFQIEAKLNRILAGGVGTG
jgi:heptosyltransferase-1